MSEMDAIWAEFDAAFEREVLSTPEGYTAMDALRLQARLGKMGYTVDRVEVLPDGSLYVFGYAERKPFIGTVRPGDLENWLAKQYDFSKPPRKIAATVDEVCALLNRMPCRYARA